MLSRTADNLYWLARYMERADCLARIIDAAQRLATMPRGTGPGHGVGELGGSRPLVDRCVAEVCGPQGT